MSRWHPIDERVERLPLLELAEYLNHSLKDLSKFARKAKLVHRGARWLPSSGCNKVYLWVTPWGAMRCIEYARAKQGEIYLGGRNYAHRKAYILEWNRRLREKRKIDGVK